MEAATVADMGVLEEDEEALEAAMVDLEVDTEDLEAGMEDSDVVMGNRKRNHCI